jgi:hypothetical protein
LVYRETLNATVLSLWLITNSVRHAADFEEELYFTRCVRAILWRRGQAAKAFHPKSGIAAIDFPTRPGRDYRLLASETLTTLSPASDWLFGDGTLQGLPATPAPTTDTHFFAAEIRFAQ